MVKFATLESLINFSPGDEPASKESVNCRELLIQEQGESWGGRGKKKRAFVTLDEVLPSRNYE